MAQRPPLEHYYSASAGFMPLPSTSASPILVGELSPAGSTPAADRPSPALSVARRASSSGQKRAGAAVVDRGEGSSGHAHKTSPASEVDDAHGGGGSTKADKSAKRVKVGARASIACKTCRKRKVRCSGEWPICAFCTRKSLPCEYEGHPAETGGPVDPNAFLANGSGVAASLSNFEAALPPASDILDALDYFFPYNYDAFYFLHRPTLTDSIQNGTVAHELVFCILAFAARHSQKLIQLHPDGASEHFAALATQILLHPSPRASDSTQIDQNHRDSDITLSRCQAFLMLGLYECTASHENSGWLRIGHAIRMAQILRLGFEDEDEGSATAGSRPAKDPIQSEERRRTFWACFLLDRTVSDGKERPCILKAPLPSALRLPGPDADYHAGQLAHGARFDPDPPLWSVPSNANLLEEPEADLYGLTLRVAELWQKVATYVGSGGRNFDRRAPWAPDSTFAALQRDLSVFQDRLPSHFKYNEANLTALSMVGGQVRLFGMMHLLFETAKLVLHRDYLPFLPPPNFRAGEGPTDGEPLYGDPTAPAGWWQKSFNHSVDAAGKISDILSSTAQHGAIIAHPFAGFSALASATIHMHLKYWPQSSDVPVSNALHIEQTTSILTALRDIYPIAGGWCDGLAKLQLLYYNLVRGVLDVDPVKVRASVVQLLRTSTDHPERERTDNKLNAGLLADAGAAINNDIFTPPLNSQAGHIDTSQLPLSAHVPPAPALDLNTEFDFLLPGHGQGADPFDVWGTGGWGDLSLLSSSLDQTWPTWNGGGQPFSFN